MEHIVKVFKALSNDVRLQILSILSSGPLCVNALVCRLDISQPAVSQHLRVLENAGLVRGKKEGYRVHYSLVPGSLADCSSFLEELRR
jgi:ArsR family transcriptional regulator